MISINTRCPSKFTNIIFKNKLQKIYIYNIYMYIYNFIPSRCLRSLYLHVDCQIRTVSVSDSEDAGFFLNCCITFTSDPITSLSRYSREAKTLERAVTLTLEINSAV